MGAAFSGASLCRFVGATEIVISTVILGFGSYTLKTFYSMDDEFRSKEDVDKIQYSAITAVIQSTLTIVASLMLLIYARRHGSPPPLPDPEEDVEAGESSSEDDLEEAKKRPSVKSHTSSASTRRKRIRQQTYMIRKRSRKMLSIIYKLWLAYSVISIGLLLLVFCLPFSLCVQTQVDIDRHGELKAKDEGGKGLVPCYADPEEGAPQSAYILRLALGNLYSYSLVNVFILFLFMFVVYYQIKRVHQEEEKENDDYYYDDDTQKVLPKTPKTKNPTIKVERENGDGTSSSSGNLPPPVPTSPLPSDPN